MLSVEELSRVRERQDHEPVRCPVSSCALANTTPFAQSGLLVARPVPTQVPLSARRYTLTNLAAFFLEISGVPNWRPTYRFFSWQTSLLGAALTLAAMVYLNVAFAAITAAVVGAVYAYLSLCFDGSAWADISSALTFRQARAALRRGGVLHAKYWRPVLMLVQPDGPQDAREKLRALCDGLAQTGLLLTAKVHVGSGLPYSPARGGTNAPPTICMRSSSSTVGTATVATTDIASVPTSVSGFNAAHAAPDESTTGVSTSFRNGCAAEPSRASTQSNAAPCTVALSFEQQVVGETWRAAIANLALSAGLGTLTPHTFVLPLPESAPFSLPIANLEEYRATLIDLLCLEKHLLLATNFASSRGSARPSLSAGGEGAASASASASAAPVSPACGCVDVWLFGEMPAEGTAAAAEAHAELALAIQYAHLAVKAEASRRAWPRAARMLSALFRGRNERAPLELEQSRNLSSASSRAGETDTASTSAAASSVCASTATTASASASAAMSLSAPASTPARTAYAPPCAPPMSSGQLPTLRLLQLRLAPTSEQIASGTRLADAQASSALRAWLREARLCGEVRAVSLAAPSLARLHVAGEWAWLADAGAADAVNGCLRAESAAAATSLAMLPMPPFGTATSGAATSGASGSCDAHSAEAAEADLGVLARVAEGLPPVLFCKSASAAPVITRDI
uniref:Uncharacterized protein n=1 Tax=Chrysotila carterae TaxID=13221 RepID=A0A7S4BEQ0_CHRCT